MFDIALIISIFTSVIVILLDSVARFRAEYGSILLVLEWFFTILFTLEYLLRLWISQKPIRYATSFYGLVDFISVVPTYLGLLIPGAHILIIVRVLRLLRLFRVFKLIRYVEEAGVLITALLASRRKIIVFLTAVLSITVIIGSFMYLIEGPENGFVSIPSSMYWCIVTMTTVGFGDITPNTTPGRFLASVLMIMGYGILAIPTGVFSAELSRAARKNRICSSCYSVGHENEATFCKDCGEKLL